jgi:hypothetical protein
VTGNLPPAGFEDRDDHRTACASKPNRYSRAIVLRIGEWAAT